MTLADMTPAIFLLLTFGAPIALWLTALAAATLLAHYLDGEWGVPDAFVFTPGGAFCLIAGGSLVSLAIQFVTLVR